MSTPESLVIDVVSDVVCPWCYVGKKRLETALDLVPEVPTELRWRPFQLDPTIPPQGVPRAAYMEKKFGSLDKIAPIHARLNALGHEIGIPFDFAAITISPNTLDAHRLIRWAFGERQDAMVETLFRAFFVEGKNLADHDVLADLAGSADLLRAEVRAALDTDEDMATVNREIAAAQELGIQGVPFFIFGQKYAVSGAESPAHLAAAIRQAAGLATPDA